MIKNVLAMLLTIVMLFSFTVVVFAESDDLEILPDSYDIGDVDMDGKISIMDATELQMHLAMLIALSDKQLKYADTNFDGTLSIMDATGIQMHLAGISEIVVPTRPTEPTQKPTVDDDKPIELPFVPAK